MVPEILGEGNRGDPGAGKDGALGEGETPQWLQVAWPRPSPSPCQVARQPGITICLCL